MDFSVEITSNGRGPGKTDDIDFSDVASDLRDAFEALQKLPSNRALAVTFKTEDDAKLFVRKGKAWAAAQGDNFTYTDSKGVSTEGQGLQFYRVNKDDEVKTTPNKVRFRITVKRPSKSE